MRKMFLTLTTLLTALSLSAQPTVESLAGLDLYRIDRDVPTEYELPENMKGNVTLIEFWEFWCGPCIQNMLHFEELQKAFPGGLKIVYVSADDEAAARKVVEGGDYPFDFVHDPKKQLNALFPHRTIPFTVIYDRQGKYIGATHPANISEQTIRDILAGNPVTFPKNEFESATVAQPASGSTERSSLFTFDLKKTDLAAGDRSFSSLTNNPAPESETGRIVQFEIRGYNVAELMSMLYNIPPYRAVVPEGAEAMVSQDPKDRYDVHYTSTRGGLGVESMKQTPKYLRKLLQASFGIDVRIEKRETDAWILTSVRESEKIKPARPYQQSSDNPVTLKEDYIEIKTGRMPIVSLVSLFEDMSSTPIIVESGQKMYEINLRIDYGGYPEDPADLPAWREKLFERLNEAGLVLEKGRREVDFLVIEEEK